MVLYFHLVLILHLKHHTIVSVRLRCTRLRVSASDHGDGDGDGDHSVHGAPGSWCRWCRLELTMEGVVAILSFTTGPRAYVTYYCCWSKSAILGQKFIFLIYCVTKLMVKICA